MLTLLSLATACRRHARPEIVAEPLDASTDAASYDLDHDVDHCGRAPHACGGGACRDGHCVERIVTTAATLWALEMAPSDDHIVVARTIDMYSGRASDRVSDTIAIDLKTGDIRVLFACGRDRGCFATTSGSGQIVHIFGGGPYTGETWARRSPDDAWTRWREMDSNEPKFTDGFVYWRTGASPDELMRMPLLGHTSERVWRGPTGNPPMSELVVGFGRAVLWDGREDDWLVDGRSPARSIRHTPSLHSPFAPNVVGDPCHELHALGRDAYVANDGTLVPSVDRPWPECGDGDEVLVDIATGRTTKVADHRIIDWSVSRDGTRFVGVERPDGTVVLLDASGRLNRLPFHATTCVLTTRLICLRDHARSGASEILTDLLDLPLDP